MVKRHSIINRNVASNGGAARPTLVLISSNRHAGRNCQITHAPLYSMQITAKITPKQNARATLVPVSFCLSAAQKMQKTKEKNHAEKAGTELRIRHV
jgi:hypothetical protein